MKKEDYIAYEILVKSFKDSNGDGWGDLRGIISKLDYIKDLGVNYIWLTPIYETPNFDNGYDIKDYFTLNNQVGNFSDFEELIEKSRNLDLNIMMDIVVNHTSTHHEWFLKALKGDKYYQDFYYFEENKNNKPPTNWKSKFGGSAWEFLPELNMWYLHLYDATQADLNWENENVVKEIYKIIDFWLNKGVSGLRFDVINVISKPPLPWKDDLEGDGRRFYTDGPKIHKYIKTMVKNTLLVEENLLSIAELSSTDITNVVEYTNPNNKEFVMAFNFHHLKVDYKNGDKWTLMTPDLNKFKNLIQVWQEKIQEGNGWLANFLSNHDQPRHVSRFGNDEKFHSESAKAFGMLYIFLRGTPFIYFGEEIGITNAYFDIEDYRDVESLNYFEIMLEKGISKEKVLEILKQKSRDNGRTLMAWDDSNNAGFTVGEKSWIKPSPGYKTINVANQIEDKNSILSFYKEIISLRKTKDVLSLGSIKFIESPDGIMIYKRILDDNQIIVIINMTDKIISIDESLIIGNIIINNYSDLSNNLKPFQAVAVEV